MCLILVTLLVFEARNAQVDFAEKQQRKMNSFHKKTCISNSNKALNESDMSLYQGIGT